MYATEATAAAAVSKGVKVAPDDDNDNDYHENVKIYFMITIVLT